MGKILALLVATLLAPTAHAQYGMGPGPGTAHTTSAPYSGPLDAYSNPGTMVGAWCLRACSAADATALSPALNVTDSTTSTTADIHVTSAGVLNNAGAGMTNCGGSDTCVVNTVYGQGGLTGNGTATGAARPAYSASCAAFNSKPCLIWTSANVMTFATASAAAEQPQFLSVVVERTAGFTTTQTFAQLSSSTNMQYFFDSSANHIAFYDGATTCISGAAATDSVAHSLQYFTNAASTELKIDSAAESGFTCANVNGSGTTFGIGTSNAPVGFSTTEMIVWGASTATAGNRTAVQGNQKAFWSTP